MLASCLDMNLKAFWCSVIQWLDQAFIGRTLALLIKKNV